MTEYQHQRTVMEWSCYASNRIRYPGLDLLYHIPNEIKCNAAQGKQRKDIGVKSGVPDLCLPERRGCCKRHPRPLHPLSEPRLSRLVHRNESRTGQSIRKPEDVAETIDGAGLSCKGLLWI